jgi:HSP20 family protein
MRLLNNYGNWNTALCDIDSFMNGLLSRPSLNSFKEDTYGFRMDTYSDDDSYYIVAELPGIPKDSIQLKIENRTLTVSGEHKKGDEGNERVVRFNRSIRLGEHVNENDVSAKLENGLLKIRLPKAEEKKAKSITIN